jgi:simple sugar transport system ATP-binding protein
VPSTDEHESRRTDTDPPRLEVRQITKRFPGVLANDHVSFTVNPGEIVGVLGENGAGKSTLMNIISGLLKPDSGEIWVDGKLAAIKSPIDSYRLGIGMVHQHLLLVPGMTVAENVAIGMRGKYPVITDLRRVSNQIREMSRRYGLQVDPSASIDDLSLGARQRVEIVKALCHDPTLLVLDEPSSVLTPAEWLELAAILRALVADGRSIVLITHKLDELLDVSQRIYVMRDGSMVGEVSAVDASPSQLAELMVGREVLLRATRDKVALGESVLTVHGLGLERAGRQILGDISFDVHRGEIFAIAGVDGNGQDELLDVLVGLAEPGKGGFSFLGSVENWSPKQFMRRGGAAIPADRQAKGVALQLSIRDNLLMTGLDSPQFSRKGMLRTKAIQASCDRLIADFRVRTPDSGVLMQQLSGGNQQRALIAREMSRQPELIIAGQPTRGLDVSAIEFVHELLLDHRRRGGAVLLISTELNEVLALGDRIGVMVDGRMSEAMASEDATSEKLGLLMAGAEARV